MSEEEPLRIAGRPSGFNNEIADEICTRIANGESMRKICDLAHMPNRETVIRWMVANEEFAAKCARARTEQADFMDDKILDVAEKCENGLIDPQAAKVAISAYQWRASKLKPKVYGDNITLKGDKENPLFNVADALQERISRYRKTIDHESSLPVLDNTYEPSLPEPSDK